MCTLDWSWLADIGVGQRLQEKRLPGDKVVALNWVSSTLLWRSNCRSPQPTTFAAEIGPMKKTILCTAIIAFAVAGCDNRPANPVVVTPPATSSPPAVVTPPSTTVVTPAPSTAPADAAAAAQSADAAKDAAKDASKDSMAAKDAAAKASDAAKDATKK